MNFVILSTVSLEDFLRGERFVFLRRLVGASEQLVGDKAEIPAFF